MAVEISAGGIVVYRGEILLVKQTATNTWAFPKGHVEGKESLIQAARREILEETGLIHLKLICKLGNYSRGSRKSLAVKKRLFMFLFTSVTNDVASRAQDVSHCLWVRPEQVEQMLGYKEDASFFREISVRQDFMDIIR